ncbi:hypothetical protein DCO56_08850 [Sphingobacterium athyrii]|uniref:Uncharacterized protein n=1 Tax=Sphingobacterium athyrii TaxID=2152717 RepID=A0A363NWC4_9SPHI|nr:hypothetical protein DCO56_08850 [Sphingobacterium athyrii]
MFYRIKIQELLYHLFSNLLKRAGDNCASITNPELDKIYETRSSVVSDLGKPPRLSELAKSVGMSEKKIKLFI